MLSFVIITSLGILSIRGSTSPYFYFLSFRITLLSPLLLSNRTFSSVVSSKYLLFSGLKSILTSPTSPSKRFFFTYTILKFGTLFFCKIITESASYVIFAVPNIDPTVKLLSSSTFLGCITTAMCTFLSVAICLRIDATLSCSSNLKEPYAYCDSINCILSRHINCIS